MKCAKCGCSTSKFSGTTNFCSNCIREYNKNYYLVNRKRILLSVKSRYKKDRLKILIYQKIYSQKHKDKISKYQKRYAVAYRKIRNLAQQARRRIDRIFRMVSNLRSRLTLALRSRRWQKHTAFSKYIGCDVDCLRKHIEKLFKPGMSWSNYGNWHIDHIRSLHTAQTPSELITLCHYTNLRPLWAVENLTRPKKLKGEK